MRLPSTQRRRGTIVPLLAFGMIALLGMVALAIDIGMIAVARTQAQDAADIAALTGARTLNGDSTNQYAIGTSITNAQTAATNNKILTTSITSVLPTL